MLEGLTEQQCDEIRKLLDNSVRPLFFFHDDPDGLASYFQMYRYKGEGRGSIIKSTPELGEKHISVVEALCPDLIVVLDVAKITEDFVSHVNVPIVMIDHHGEEKPKGVHYYNPRLNEPSVNVPTSQLCYQITKGHTSKDLMWVAMVGCVGDWYLPTFAKEFSEKYPTLLTSDIDTPQRALFTTALGDLIRIFSFLVKGPTREVHKMLRSLLTINDPLEILEKKSRIGKSLFNYAHKFDSAYQLILDSAKAQPIEDGMVIYRYSEAQTSFTKEIANAMLFERPESVILIGRQKGDEIRMSLRSPPGIIINEALQNALQHVEGYGGGHEHACGACVKVHHFDIFLENLRMQIFKNQKSLLNTNGDKKER